MSHGHRTDIASIDEIVRSSIFSCLGVGFIIAAGVTGLITVVIDVAGSALEESSVWKFDITYPVEY